METNKERLSKEIDAVLNRTMPRFSSIKICEHTPKLLLNLGLDDYPILFSQRHTRDCLHPKDKNPHHHGLTKEFLLNMPLYLDNPAMVLDSLSNPYSIVVLTGEVDGDNIPVLASITINGDGIYEAQKIDSNYMTSVYGKNNLENIIEDYIASDNVLFVNKEKTQNLESFAKLQLLGKFSKDFEFNKIIHKSNNIVNEDDAIIASFREKTDELFNREAVGGLSPEEIEGDVEEYIRRVLADEIPSNDIEIKDVIITGSRSIGLESFDSDLDVVLAYTGSEKEYVLFNALNEEPLEINGIRVDINPIRPEETGELAEYLINAEKYLEERRKEMEQDNIFGKGNWGIEYIDYRNDYRVYEIDHPESAVAYVDSIEDARDEAKRRGIELFIGSVEYSFDENNNRISRFVPAEDSSSNSSYVKEPENDYGSFSLKETNEQKYIDKSVANGELDDLDGEIERDKVMQNRLDIERLYTLDEVYEEADGKARFSPELKRKDRALIEFTDWLHNNGYMDERSSFDSWEDAMDHTIKAWNISALFSESGTLLYVREGKERLNSLEKDYIYELSSSQIQNMLDDFANDRPSLPEGLFYERGNTVSGEPVFTAIDNSGGEMYMEDFKTYYSMVQYLEGEDTDILHEREAEWEFGIDGGRTVIQLFRQEIEELKRDNNLDSDSEVFERFKNETFTKDFFKKEESEVAEPKDVKETIKEKVLGKENSIMSEEKKNENVEVKEGEKKEFDGRKVFINMHKSFCYQTEDKFEKGKLFNTMTMPKGLELNGQDLSGCTIHPKYMNENQKNPNEMTATYYVGKDSTLEVNVNKDGINVGKVDIDDLKAAIDKQREAYREQQKEQQKDQNRVQERAKEKDNGEEI